MAFHSASEIARIGGVPSVGIGAPEDPVAPEVGSAAGGLCGVTSGGIGGCERFWGAGSWLI